MMVNSSEDHLRTKKYYDEFAKFYDYERAKGYFKFINALEVDLVKDFSRNKRVLEVGCGTGLILREVSKFADTAIGVDISDEMLAKARQKGLNVLKASAIDLPLKNDVFDVVFSFKTLAHIPEIRKAISEMERVCKKNGLLILEFYNPYSLKFILNKIFNFLKGRKVYIRYDSYGKIKNYLGTNKEILKIRGIRIFTPFSSVFKIPLLSNLFKFLELKFCDSVLKYLGGYLVVIAKIKSKSKF